VICDLDVDAPDLHLLLNPEKEKTHSFVSGHEAKILENRCDNCGVCIETCRFGAILEGDLYPTVNPMKCEGCKVCVEMCPSNAVAFPEKQCGEWYLSKTRFGWMVHAQLFPAEENSGRLVATLRQEAKALAQNNGLDLILSDGPPGIGCPVISSLSGADMAVLVTEPTPSGQHDLERVAELCAHFSVPAGVIVNKWDLSEDNAGHIESFCLKKGLKVFGRLPHDRAITDAMVSGLTITEHTSNGMAREVADIWGNIRASAKL
jgi:MinD superfamily P-loop ATPase